MLVFNVFTIVFSVTILTPSRPPTVTAKNAVTAGVRDGSRVSEVW